MISRDDTALSNLIDPALLQSVEGLALAGRILVEEYFSGTHRSLRLGQGMEFSQYRAYEPGDDLRLLDWKLVARKDRYYVRQSELESGTIVKFILDASGSMGMEYNGQSKLDFSKILISALAYLSAKQGDSVGFYAANQSDHWHVEPARSGQQFMRLLHGLLHVESNSSWQTQVNRMKRDKSMILFITDMYELEDEIIEELAELNSPLTDISVLHITTPDEWEPPHQSPVILQEIETGKRVKLDPRTGQKEYKERWRTFISKTERNLLEKHIYYHVVRMDEPLHQTIKYFLDRKARQQ